MRKHNKVFYCLFILAMFACVVKKMEASQEEVLPRLPSEVISKIVFQHGSVGVQHAGKLTSAHFYTSDQKKRVKELASRDAWETAYRAIFIDGGLDRLQNKNMQKLGNERMQNLYAKSYAKFLCMYYFGGAWGNTEKVTILPDYALIKEKKKLTINAIDCDVEFVSDGDQSTLFRMDLICSYRILFKDNLQGFKKFLDDIAIHYKDIVRITSFHEGFRPFKRLFNINQEEVVDLVSMITASEYEGVIVENMLYQDGDLFNNRYNVTIVSDACRQSLGNQYLTAEQLERILKKNNLYAKIPEFFRDTVSTYLRSYDVYGFTTPLHLACKNNNRDFIELLIQYGANPFGKDSDNKTPLDYITDMQLKNEILGKIHKISSPKHSYRFKRAAKIVLSSILLLGVIGYAFYKYKLRMKK
jgi:hypothetical protein